jgi:exodeoxyribonuclease III
MSRRRAVKITTWNVNGIRAREAQVAEWVRTEQPDVLALQEVKASPEQVPASLCALEGYQCYWHGFKGYSGVGLLMRRSTFGDRLEVFHPSFDLEHRIVVAHAGDALIASIYVPNGNKDYAAKVRFLLGMDVWVRDLGPQRALVLCGDLNVAKEPRDVHPALRKPTQIGQTPEEQVLLGNVLAHDLVDLGRKFEPDNDRLFTWWAPWRSMRERNIGWRLDYVAVSSSLAERAISCAVRRDFGTSDHGPVTAIFAQ